MGVTGVNGQDLAALSDRNAVRTPAPGFRSREAEPKRPPPVQWPNSGNSERQEQRAARTVANAPIESTHRAIRFDEDSNRIVVQVIAESNEVIKQIPPAEALRIASRLRQIQGMLFDERA